MLESSLCDIRLYVFLEFRNEKDKTVTSVLGIIFRSEIEQNLELEVSLTALQNGTLAFDLI